MRRHRSQVLQAIHYFGRPQERVLRAPLNGPSAWRGADLADGAAWREALSEADIVEIEAAIRHARLTRLPLAALSVEDFPLPNLADKIRRFRDTIQNGRGFQVVTGIPVERWTVADAELFFWCFGLHIGIPGAQNPEGDLLGHVRDTGAPCDGSVRQYRTREHIDFHCDAADSVGLLCLKQAKSGGKSVLASSVYAYDEVLRRRPDLVDRLYRPFLLDTKGEAGVPYVGVVPCAHAGGALRTFWHGGYFRSVSRLPNAPPLDPDAAALLDLYDEILNEPGASLSMHLEPGDMQLLSNHTVVHSRTSFVDHDEPERKRHLLRLWLSLPEPQSISMSVRKVMSSARVVANLGRARLRAAM